MQKTYVLDSGDYYFAIGNNVHDALNNILAAQGMTTQNGMDEEECHHPCRLVGATNQTSL